MAEQASADPPDTSSSSTYNPSEKRKMNKMIGSSASELFPEHSWFAISHQTIQELTCCMCTKLTSRMHKYSNLDQIIQDLLSAAEAAKKYPKVKPFCVGASGEQGIGKSTLLNALLRRDLLSTSAGVRACTAFVTIITHKEGADDNTNLSDIMIQFCNKAEREACIKEQITNYSAHQDGADQNQPSYDSDSSEVSEDSESSDADEPEDAEDTSPGATKDVEAKKNATKTAKEFFQIIFNTKDNEKMKEWLDHQLNHTNIREGEFFAECCRAADAQLQHFDSELENKDGASTHEDISDKMLKEIRKKVLKLWPFVKSMTIATGHPLLRYGLALYDLPGYGDTSQLREAIINRYRNETDFDLVVAPHSRFDTSSTQERYLLRSLRRKGPGRMIIVLIRSDGLLNPRDFDNAISELKEPPFPDCNLRLEALEESDQDIATKRALRYEIYREALVAYIQREKAVIDEGLREKNIRSFSVSAESYLGWIQRDRLDQDPPLDEEACGMRQLLRFLYELPANANYQSYYDHAFRKLPRIIVTAQHIFSAHVEDQGYAAMRQELSRRIPMLKSGLDEIIKRELKTIVTGPWSSEDTQSVNDRVKGLIRDHWKHPEIYWTGFQKILREKGIPISGQYYGRNLNEDVMQVVEGHIEEWHEDLQKKIKELTQIVNEAVQTFLRQTETSIDISSTDEELKGEALEALEQTSEEIDVAHNALLDDLTSALEENYVNFTAEEDIDGTVAKEMAPVYAHALGIRQGKDVYNRTRDDILKSIFPQERKPGRQPKFPVLENVRAKILTHQRNSWDENCQVFAKDVVAALEEFVTTCEELLQSGAYTTEQHEQARVELQEALKEFKIDLDHLQDQFPVEGHATKRVKCELVE